MGSYKLLILSCLTTGIVAPNPEFSCVWPCVVRGTPWYVDTDTVWFVDQNGVGTWNNVSRPIGDQFTHSDCIEYRVSFTFIVVKEYDMYYCVRSAPINSTLRGYWKTSYEISNYNKHKFCQLCNMNDMIGPFFATWFLYNPDPNLVTKPDCTIPASCVNYNYKGNGPYIACPPGTPPDASVNC